jgi:signal transduction histidine kinase
MTRCTRSGASLRQIMSTRKHRPQRDTAPSRAAELVERAKELSCLISVSRVLADRKMSLSDALARVVEEIPRGWQAPALAAARLRLHDTEWIASNFAETPWTMFQVISTQAGPVGSIEVAYCEDPVRDPVFLPEESQLLQAVAERVADLVELDAAQNALGTYQNELRSLASQLSITEERERREIATSLHDGIGQELALVKLRLESLRGRAREDADNQTIDQVCEIAAEVIRKTRTLMFEISPPILHELGLTPAIEWLADTIRSRHGLSVEVDAEPVTVIEEDLRALLFRSTHELLNNVVRHASARAAVVRVRASTTSLRIEVEDDGRGYDQPLVAAVGATGGFGLFSIRERLAHLGGRLEVFSKVGRGTRAVIEAPTTKRGPPS